ncbi:hypothetical protein Poly41_30000 [Novipirellula artificiosorum]|uniref:Uncharacterized protein n=1 Tax=Novipirellula artificiosorum TaxID=2528016 RepID=A0A5C6DME8_9BACT|nr:hypothetical protein Poly41_30000 [Novipirellula artificiosorum]
MLPRPQNLWVAFFVEERPSLRHTAFLTKTPFTKVAASLDAL